MVKLNCSVCVFGELCPSVHTCRFFSPMGEAESMILDGRVELLREDYYTEWQEYLKDNGDDFFF